MTDESQQPDVRELPPFGEIDIDLFTEPVRHGNKQFRDFARDFKAELLPHSWMTFVGEVHVFWTLYLSEYERQTSDRGADLDNFVKGLNDCIKGPDGLLVDDSQIQSLTVRWLPKETGQRPRSMRLQVSDPILRMMREPLRMYELADNLFYPLPDQKREEHKYMLLSGIDRSLSTVSGIARSIYGADASGEDVHAFRMMHGPIAEGFFKTRVAESGYELVSRDSWQADMEAWRVSEGRAPGERVD